MRREPLPLWMNGAACGWHSHLPWTGDFMPEGDTYAEMSRVCADCPVVIECSRHALDEASGGFFAGVWLPWNDGGTKNRRVRGRARAALRSRVKGGDRVHA